MRRGLAPLAAVLLALVLTACGSDPSSFTGHRLQRAWPASDLSLTDTAGAPYSLARNTEDKKLTLVFFGYTHCPDFCPLAMNNIAAAFNRLDDQERADTGMVFVTTDPARDDAKTLRSYLDGYNRSFVGLTGPIQQVVKVGTPFNVYVSDGKKLPSGGYDLGGHSTFILGLQDGKADVFWQGTTPATQLASDIHSLLSED